MSGKSSPEKVWIIISLNSRVSPHWTSDMFSLSVSNGTVPAPVSPLSATPVTVSASRSGSSRSRGAALMPLPADRLQVLQSFSTARLYWRVYSGEITGQEGRRWRLLWWYPPFCFISVWTSTWCSTLHCEYWTISCLMCFIFVDCRVFFVLQSCGHQERINCRFSLWLNTKWSRSHAFLPLTLLKCLFFSVCWEGFSKFRPWCSLMLLSLMMTSLMCRPKLTDSSVSSDSWSL